MNFPHSLPAEQALLGAVMIDGELLAAAQARVSEVHFYRDAHKRIWRAVCSLAERKSGLDLVTVVEELRRTKDIDEVGGPAYVSGLLDCGVRSANIEHYAGIVRDKALRRRVMEAASKLLTAAEQSDEEASAVVDSGIQALLAVSSEASPGDLVFGPQLCSEAMTWLDEQAHQRRGRSYSGVPSGLVDLDQMTDGFQPGDLAILAARPSQGKSSAALQFALSADGPVAFFSVEMSRRQLAARSLATLGRFDGWAMRRGTLSSDELQRMRVAMQRLGDSELGIDDSSRITVAQVRAKSLRVQRERGLRMIVCDYLQILTPASTGGKHKDQTREQEVAGITRSLKVVAKDLQVPVLALAQLSRAAESARSQEPTLAHLRESGAVEQDADLVLFIHRPDGQTVAKEGPAKLIVAKNRTGPTGTVDLTWYPTFTRFDSASTQPQMGLSA